MNDFIEIPKENLFHEDGYLIYTPGYILLEESHNFFILINMNFTLHPVLFTYNN